ncbi:MAG TPA: chemotaxis protein CheW [Leptolyngbyaceae cyanobacterium]
MVLEVVSKMVSSNPSLPTEVTAMATQAEQQFLQIYLDQELPFLLPVESLVEIMKVPIGQVVPMFQMAPWVMGVYNWRGEVLWMADLNHFLGLAPWYEQAEPTTKHTAVVIKSPRSTVQPGDKPALLGLIVSRAEGMISYPVEAIQPSAEKLEISSNFLPFLQGYYLEDANAPRLVLDGAAILLAMSRAS